MRKLFVVGMGGLLAGLIGLVSAPTWADRADDGAQLNVAQRGRGMREGMGTARERAPQARETARQDAGEWQQAWKGLSSQDQATLTQAWSDATEKVKGLTPEQKQKIRKDAVQTAERLQNLSPEQKAKLEAQLRKSSQTYASLTAEQKQEILTQMASSIDRMGSVSPEQKAQLKANYQKLLGL